MQQVELMLWNPCSSPHDCCLRRHNLLHWREWLSHGLPRLSIHWRGNRAFMTFYVFGAAVSFLPFNWWQVWNVFFLFLNHVVFSLQTQFRVMVGGHLKWTPQRPCLGNEIALDMAFCHVPPLCILMICGTWHSTALKDSHTSLIRLTAHSLPLVSSVSFLLVFLLVCPNSLLLWRPNSHLILLHPCHFCFNFRNITISKRRNVFSGNVTEIGLFFKKTQFYWENNDWSKDLQYLQNYR